MRRSPQRAAAVASAALLATVGTAAAANLIKNPKFASGLRHWRTGVVSSGSFPGYPHIAVATATHCTPAKPHLEIDVPGGADGWAEQQLKVPRSPGRLKFLTWGNLDPVHATVSIVTTNGVMHTLLSYTPPTLQASPTTCTHKKPVRESLSLKAFAGQKVELRLEASSTGIDGTIVDFDNFSLSGRSRHSHHHH